jgi:hypothetical protein
MGLAELSPPFKIPWVFEETGVFESSIVDLILVSCPSLLPQYYSSSTLSLAAVSVLINSSSS